MLTRVKDAILWAQALDRYERERFQEAIDKLNGIGGQRKLASEYLALLGSAHLALGMSEGRAYLVSATRNSAPTRPEYRRYVDAYCEHYLSIIDGNDGLAVKALESALRMDAPAIIRRWLPLS